MCDFGMMDDRPAVGGYRDEFSRPFSYRPPKPEAVLQAIDTGTLAQRSDIALGDVIDFMGKSADLNQLKKFKKGAMSLIRKSNYRGYWITKRKVLHAVSGYDLTAGFQSARKKLKKSLDTEQFPVEPRFMKWLEINNPLYPIPSSEIVRREVPCNLSSKVIRYTRKSWGADKAAPIGRLRSIYSTYIPATRDQEREEVLRRYEDAKQQVDQRRINGTHKSASPGDHFELFV